MNGRLVNHDFVRLGKADGHNCAHEFTGSSLLGSLAIHSGPDLFCIRSLMQAVLLTSSERV